MEAEGGIRLPTQEQLNNLPKDVRLKQAAEAAEAAANANGLVASLRKKAAALMSPKERERMLTEAFGHEAKAKGLTKKARILQSGTFQGAVSGAGIGAATAAGLGTAVGTLVGTVTSIPTTALGGLVGAGTGLIHGPWIKLSLPGGKEEDVQVPQESIDSGAVRVDEKTGTVTANDPEALREAAAAAREAAEKAPSSKPLEGEKRKPKKLEIRSKPQQQQASAKSEGATQKTTNASASGKKKPPKLETKPKQAQKV